MTFKLKSYQLCIVLALFSLIGNGTSVRIPVEPHDNESEDWDYPSTSVTTFIINGSFAELGEFPHNVALYNTSKDEYIHCGGSIITPRLILTAAHCFEHIPPRDLQVIAGLTNLNLNGRGTEQTRNASYVYVHEDYDDKTQVNDLAIMELDSALVYNAHVRNIPLLRENATFERNVTVIGWGSTELDCYSSKLKKGYVPIVQQEKCKKVYGNSSFLVTENNLCAGTAGGGVCNGDSGGPAICKTSASVSTASVLCGVVSFGGICGRSPGVFTRVTSFVKWIEQAEGNINAQKLADKLAKNGINSLNDKLETPLHHAAKLTDKTIAVKVIKRMIEMGADVSAEDSEGYTFLHRLLNDGSNKITPNQFRNIVEYLVSENLVNLFNIQEPTQGRTPLMLAAVNLDLYLDTLSLLRSNGVDFTLLDKSGKSVLFYAAEESNNQKLLAGILKVGTTKLEEAITGMDKQSVKLLVRLGADVNGRNGNLEAPLHYAAASDDKTFAIKCIKFLIDNGADASVRDGEGQNFLHKLLSDGTTLTPSGLLDITQYLFSKRSSDLFNNQDGERGSTPLMLAAKNVEFDETTLKLLQRIGVNFAMVDKYKRSYLFYAAEGNKNRELLSEEIKSSIKHRNLSEAIDATDEHSVKMMVWLGADLNETNDELETPLHLAAVAKNTAFAVHIIKFLIDSGANAYAIDRYGYSFLRNLVRSSRMNPRRFHDISAFLISKNLSSIFNTPGGFSRVTPFQWAVDRVEMERATLSLLKNNGVDFNAVDYRGGSVLLWATSANRTLRLVSSLVCTGANPNHLNKYNQSMLHAAAYNRNVELLKFFLDNGLDVNAQDNNGDTPLHHVFNLSYTTNVFETVQFLLRNGASPYIRNLRLYTPLNLFNANRDYYPEADKIYNLLL